jgi:beta-1,4-mannosyl-glycoprotein beta-1,4-N-acetylglucosaminyltransferase
MVYDCFPFFNELDLLEVRLQEHGSQVDRFVIGESPLTFSGREKPLFFWEHRDRYAAFAGKIHHLVIEPHPAPEVTWDRERHQRAELKRGLQEAQPGDLIYSSDADEILRAEVFERCLREGPGRVWCPELRHVCYYVNCQPYCPPDNAGVWRLARLAFREDWGEFDPQQMRDFWGCPERLPLVCVPDAGWHYSWMGGYEAVQAKFAACSDRTEFVQSKASQDWVDGCLRIGRDLWTGRVMYPPRRPEGCDLPRYLREHLDRFPALVHPQHRV